jgi:hypothetical protein
MAIYENAMAKSAYPLPQAQPKQKPDAEFLQELRAECLKCGPGSTVNVLASNVIRLLLLSGAKREADSWHRVHERGYDLAAEAVYRSVEQAQAVVGLRDIGKSLADREHELLAEIARLKGKYEPENAQVIGPNPWGKSFAGGIGAAYERDWR